MIDPPTIPRDADIIAAGFVSAILILLLGLLLTVPFASAQTVPFDGRIDEVTGYSGAVAGFGNRSGYHPATYAQVLWTPTSTGIFCGFEAYATQEIPIDVSLEGSDIATITWTNESGTWNGSTYFFDFFLWPEECFTFTSGTTYSFTFDNTGDVSNVGYLQGTSVTTTGYEVWQYNDGVGWWQQFGKTAGFAIIGTENASTTDWYQQNVEPTMPVDVAVGDWWAGWRNLGTTLFTEKAPFGYVSSVAAIWDDIGSGTSSDFHLTVYGSEVSMFDATATKNVVGEGNWNLVRSFTEALIWFSFMMYIVVRVNQIEV